MHSPLAAKFIRTQNSSPSLSKTWDPRACMGLRACVMLLIEAGSDFGRDKKEKTGAGKIGEIMQEEIAPQTSLSR